MHLVRRVSFDVVRKPLPRVSPDLAVRPDHDVIVGKRNVQDARQAFRRIDGVFERPDLFRFFELPYTAPLTRPNVLNRLTVTPGAASVSGYASCGTAPFSARPHEASSSRTAASAASRLFLINRSLAKKR
jgi:hypothetical protein